MRPDHIETVECDYHIHEHCSGSLPPHEGTPHHGFIDMQKFKETGKAVLSDQVKWACSNCESCFDED